MNAALICIREERRRVREVARALELDSYLRRTEPDHHRHLLDQSWREIRELTAAIDLLKAPPSPAPVATPPPVPTPEPEAPAIEEPEAVRPRVSVEVMAPERAVMPARREEAPLAPPRRDLGLVRRVAA